MNTKLKFAFLCHTINALAMMVIGSVYVFGNEFMPFHSDVIQTNWEDLDKFQQVLYLGMMRTEGAGFLASALAIVILLLIPFKQGKVWSYWAIAAIGLVEYLPTLIATFNVSRITSASPPWPAILGGCLLLIIGLILSISNNGAAVNVKDTSA
jgi:hypothetical protein